MSDRVGEGEIKGRKTWVYDNGLEMYQDGGIAKPASHTLITVENTTAMHRARREQKRAVVVAAANAAVEREDYRHNHGDLAFVAAITEAQYIKATTPDDPKSTDAARFILTEAGISESQRGPADGENNAAVNELMQVVADIAAIVRRIDAGAEVIDGQLHEADQGQTE